MMTTTMDGSAQRAAVSCIHLVMAVLTGILIGWCWRPHCASIIILALTQLLASMATSACAFTGFLLIWFVTNSTNLGNNLQPIEQINNENRDTVIHGEEAVTVKDLEKLCCLLSGKDGGPPWQDMMEKVTPLIAFRAWYREPRIGPMEYHTRTIFENINPEAVRDFFWDDDFRPNWDDMLANHTILGKSSVTGTMICHWRKKFPLFLSDREYIIARRIWKDGRTYFCVTKGIEYPIAERYGKTVRVNLYSSCWQIRAVESRRGDGQLTSSEVILFHQEDVGISNRIAKVAIRQRMWGYVEKTSHGLYAYKTAQLYGAPVSRYALIAQINSKVPAHCLSSLGLYVDEASQGSPSRKKGKRIKWIIVGALALLCMAGKRFRKGLKFLGRET